MSSQIRHPLPLPLSSFIGRKKEIAEIIERIAPNRLITLAGPGGCGKTRLALEVAHKLSAGFNDGLSWVELSSLTEGNLVVHTVAEVMGLHEGQEESLEERLANFLHEKKFLLVLDNCEHLIKTCATLAENLLARSPDLKILATSREPLAIAGEFVFQVPPLTLPKSTPWQSPESVKAAIRGYERSEAVQLFRDRARAASPAFGLNIENAPWVAEICRRLDGSPLAIELAATRIRSLSARQIAERLKDRFAILTVGSRTAPPRQQTLAATLDWSYELLSLKEQRVFRRLSVFAGGWTLEMAETVCTGEGLNRGEIFEHLDSLVEKSFVIKATESRFDMLETIREYAKNRLVESDAQRWIRLRHAEAFLNLAFNTVSTEAEWPERIEAVQLMEDEHENFRVVLDWARSADGDRQLGLRLIKSLEQFWYMRGYLREGRDWIEAMLSTSEGIPEGVLASAYSLAGIFNLHIDDLERAEMYLTRSLDLFAKLGDKSETASQIHWMGVLKKEQGDLIQAEKLLSQALALHKESINNYGSAFSLAMLGQISFLRGNFGEAKSYFEEGLQLARELGNPIMVGHRLIRLSQIARAQGDRQRAIGLVSDGLRLCLEAGDTFGLALALVAMAGICVETGKLLVAAKIQDVLVALQEGKGIHLDSFDRLEINRIDNQLSELLGKNKVQQRRKQGSIMNSEQIERFALDLLDQLSVKAVDVDHDKLEEYSGLTKREREVAWLISQGKSNREIAAVMTVREETIETYVSRILGKLGFDSRVEVAVWAIKNNLGS